MSRLDVPMLSRLWLASPFHRRVTAYLVEDVPGFSPSIVIDVEVESKDRVRLVLRCVMYEVKGRKEWRKRFFSCMTLTEFRA